MNFQQTYTRLPSMISPYLKVLFSSKPQLAESGISSPSLTADIPKLKVKPKHLQRFQQVCGLPITNALPYTYLHVLAMPLKMRIFSHPNFPITILGLVHIRNVIRHWKTLDSNAYLRITVACKELKETDLGQEIDIVTRAYEGEGLVWEEISTLLARRTKSTEGKSTKGLSTPIAHHMIFGSLDERVIKIPAHIGRHYAVVSGDFNPIHLFDITAKLLRFRQKVAHGMWTVSRCLGLVQSLFSAEPLEIEVQFKSPLYLPGECLFRQQQDPILPSSINLSLSSLKDNRLHLIVRIRSLS